jgi:fibronectin type 3 domain-containing protein
MLNKLTIVLFLLISTSVFAHGNNPGAHTVLLTWQDATCLTGCTYNLYRSTSGNACTGVSNPTPYATTIPTTQYVDTNVTLGTTYHYNVSAYDLTDGGESACATEVQIAVPNITTPIPSGLTGTVQ